ncbi:hypothetical protein CesoFtcFv8_025263 [Champsocephalus esox]|uniref:Uncharacterized protein n=1 Tax=Champsocephalus esox TaxID=159716 RepID=A0AAN8B455_9TELE|nr:hypothetical protein CesoFtcFv8_025263 [Champsocephalus esox]
MLIVALPTRCRPPCEGCDNEVHLFCSVLSSPAHALRCYEGYTNPPLSSARPDGTVRTMSPKALRTVLVLPAPSGGPEISALTSPVIRDGLAMCVCAFWNSILCMPSSDTNGA